MTVEELVALRAAVDAGGPISEGTADAGAVEVVHRDGGEVNHVRVGLAAPIPLDELERGFGPARELPRLPSGGRRALFAQTMPGDGERAVTVLAELDRAGRVTAVVLRPDAF